jgi:hypothetical protein
MLLLKNYDIYKMECVPSLLCPTAYEQECLDGLGAKLLAAMVSVLVHSHVLEHDVNDAIFMSSELDHIYAEA